jgi:hypothetical protein
MATGGGKQRAIGVPELRPPDLAAHEVALEQACCVTLAFAFGDPFGDGVLGCLVVLAAVQRDRVECAVELAVAAAAEPVPLGLAA